ncbi:type VI secretion system baseplate subunit TssE [Methylobacterium nodulans]|uniref:Type VI secretion system lysozyme-related protein n=1 Tax=Methylobacterium nodulans (strain LMG 21967 / CNCM I-2342 / ORS 2060) TaxID=460265 RepID=B8IIB1_METNO|nr:type VI secretion system baseplate subunit TssE [Methylobacterium nodulans]ACL57980.1 type VI secretion system lysozyme-related protein [Methylobacterium nodulans ORS 2060]
MSSLLRERRVRASLISAFRTAHAAHDARKPAPAREAGGERVVAGRRSAARAAIPEAELRRAVAGDVETLMNTIRLGASLDLAAHPHVARSVLNYGLPDLVHRSIDEGAVRGLAEEIRATLEAHEPRLVPGSIRVARDPAASAAALKLRFLITAALDAEPLNLPVEFVADLERDTGKIVLGRRS